MNKILSISVAAYNSSDVIDDCLKSIIKSKYIDLIEVLIVDDGSKDNTVEIVKGYVKKYPKSIILLEKENGGYGSTVNLSLQKAIGKYFKTVEGDDWVNTEGLDKLIEYLKNTDVDVIVNNYEEYINYNKKYVNINKGHVNNQILNFNEINKEQVFRIQSMTVKLDIIKSVKYKISEHRFYVDSEYVFFSIMYANSIVFLKDIVYQYRLGQDGQSVSIDNISIHFKDLMYIIEKLLGIYCEVEDNIQDKSKKIYLIKNINVLYRDLYHWFMIMKKIDNYEVLKDFDIRMNRLYPNLLNKMNFGHYRFIRINHYIFLKIFRCIRNFRKIFSIKG
jgi:glycosyltransferase involved in cell wall biosynthesis